MLLLKILDQEGEQVSGSPFGGAPAPALATQFHERAEEALVLGFAPHDHGQSVREQGGVFASKRTGAANIVSSQNAKMSTDVTRESSFSRS